MKTGKRERRSAIADEMVTPAQGNRDDAADGYPDFPALVSVNSKGTLRYYKGKVKDLVGAVRLMRVEIDQLVSARASTKRDHERRVEELQRDISQRGEEIAKLRKTVYQVHLMTEE